MSQRDPDAPRDPDRSESPAGEQRNDITGGAGNAFQAGSVLGGVHIVQGAAGPQGSGDHGRPRVPRQLPAAQDTFVNRTEELDRLNAVLSGRDGGNVLVSVHIVAGTAGAGKTSLALRWAHQVKDRFPEGQLFINLRGYDPGAPVTADQALRRFLSALGVAAADIPDDTDDAAALYRSILADRRLLIVLDNAATASQVRPLLPGGGESLVVITSRARLGGLAVRNGARHLTLGTLPGPDAVALLRTVTRDYRADSDERTLAALAEHCAHLPLALRIAAERAVSHPHLGLDDLIAALRDESALWDALSTGTEEEAESVRPVFAWSYRALPPASARLFRLLGLHPGPEFGLAAAAALGGTEPSQTRRLLDDLVGAHLLEQTAPDRFQFHDLLRAYTADLARTEEPEEERGAALLRVIHWYLVGADAAQEWLNPVEERIMLPAAPAAAAPVVFADYDAAVDWAQREQDNLTAVVREASRRGYQREAWQTATALWGALPPAASQRDWLAAGRIGIAAAESAGEDRAHVRLLQFAGMAHRGLAELDAGLEVLGRASAIARNASLASEEARVVNLTGLIRLRQHALEAAEEDFTRALALSRSECSRSLEANALANIATTRLNAGHLDGSAEAADAALAFTRESGNRAGEGNLLRVLAEVRREQGDLDSARRMIDEALAIALELRDHTMEGYWLLTLGAVQLAEGHYGDALTSYRRSAMLYRRLGDRTREALAWRGTGQTYAAQDRPDEAADFHRQAAAAHRDLGDAWQLAAELAHLADAVHAADPDAAAGHRAEAASLLADFTDPRSASLRAAIDEQQTSSGNSREPDTD